MNKPTVNNWAQYYSVEHSLPRKENEETQQKAGFSAFPKGINKNKNLPEELALTALQLAQSIEFVETRARGQTIYRNHACMRDA